MFEVSGDPDLGVSPGELNDSRVTGGAPSVNAADMEAAVSKIRVLSGMSLALNVVGENSDLIGHVAMVYEHAFVLLRVHGHP